jgi:hypothetical protein
VAVLVVAAGLAVALALGGCGGGEGTPGQAAGFAQNQDIDLNTYSCADWNAADPAARRLVIERLRTFAGGDVSGGQGVRGRGTVLADDQAYSLFDNRCRDRFARGFVLYKLYTHAAAFAGRAP